MSDEIDDGGYVHPFENIRDVRGITYRQWLAGRAMQGMLSNMEDDEPIKVVEAMLAIPNLAYKMADAMITEGKKNE